MRFLDVTLPSIEANLALDEALLEQAERGEASTEILRIWEPHAAAIVVGRSSRVTDEVHREHAAADGVPVIRRCSGGAAVVMAPGCLAYALVLSYQARPHLRMIDALHQFVSDRAVAALFEIQPRIRYRGTSDLSVDDRKFSGNSVRCRRDWLLYHGTMLLDMDLSLVDRYLKPPPREPAYRRGRAHRDFVANLGLPRDVVAAKLRQAWNGTPSAWEIPKDLLAALMLDKYGNPAWNYQR